MSDDPAIPINELKSEVQRSIERAQELVSEARLVLGEKHFPSAPQTDPASFDR